MNYLDSIFFSRHRASLGSFAVFGALFFTSIVASASGSAQTHPTSFVSLDPTFNSSGYRLDRFEQNGTNSIGRAVAVQSDGKIVVAGSVRIDGFNQFGLARYNADGSPDTSFSGDGKLNWDAGSFSDVATAIVVQPDGKIVVGGSTENASATVLVRFNSNGTTDTSFGTSGQRTVPCGDFVRSLLIQPDEKIVVACGTFWLVRLNANGTFDTSFDSDGTADVRPAKPYSLALQSDGKIVAAGYEQVATNVQRFAAFRINSNGSPDPGFNGNGRNATGFTGTAYAVGLQADGKIVAAGSTQVGVNSERTRDFAPSSFAIARFNIDGTLDTSFSSDGTDTVSFLFSQWQVGHFLKILPDGKLLIGGSVYSDNYDAGLMRYNSDGTLDNTFDVDGRALVYYDTSHDLPGAMTVDSQGRVVIAGWRQVVLPDILSVTRATIGPPRDRSTSFDRDGDGRADLSVWRESNAMWYTQASESFSYTQIGAVGDKPVPGDFDGDEIDDIAVWRAANGQWLIFRSSTATLQVIGWGQAGDFPIAADMSGDGRSNPVIYRPVSRTWYIWIGNGGWTTLGQGVSGAKPLLGDFDNDGISDRALYNPDDYSWSIQRSGGGLLTMTWGDAGDIPVPADYDGDGATDIAVWRPSTGRWYIIGSSWGWMTWNVWGEPGDVPVPADYDGDGRTDIAIFRPSIGTWYIANSSDNSITLRQFGASGDMPIPAAYNY